MDMHWIASAAVLLVMALLSAYRDALKNEPIRPGLERGGVPYIRNLKRKFWYPDNRSFVADRRISPEISTGPAEMIG